MKFKVQTKNKTAFEYYIVEAESIKDIFTFMKQRGITVLGITKEDHEKAMLKLVAWRCI